MKCWMAWGVALATMASFVDSFQPFLVRSKVTLPSYSRPNHVIAAAVDGRLDFSLKAAESESGGDESSAAVSNAKLPDSSPPYNTTTSLSMAANVIAESPPTDEVVDQQEDPIELVVHHVSDNMMNDDVNGLLNTGILLVLGIIVLAKVGTVDSDMMRGWTASEMAVRIPLDNWADYSTILAQQPLATKAVTSATVYTIGDIIAQRTEGQDMGSLDRLRILRSLLAGLIGHGPLSHLWYNFSEHIFEAWHWTQWWSFLPKVAIDQATWGPFWNNVYIIMLGVMKGQNWETIWGDIKRTTVPLVVSGLKLWPLAHCVTYGLIPVENRLLWVDLVEIVWVTILATQAAGGQGTGHVEIPDNTDDDDNGSISAKQAAATSGTTA